MREQTTSGAPAGAPAVEDRLTFVEKQIRRIYSRHSQRQDAEGRRLAALENRVAQIESTRVNQGGQQ